MRNRKSSSIIAKDASIISVKTIKKGKKPLLELLVLFENFSGYHIHRKLRVWDSKPSLNRFQQDETIPVGLNVARKPKDPVFLSQDVCRFSFVFVIICSLKTIVYVMGCYVLMGEALKKIFDAPESYESVFKHSNVWEMGLIFIGVTTLMYFLLQKIGVLINGKTLAQIWNLLFYGLGTTATITGFKNTGTLINNNPVVGFTYLFESHTGQKVEGTDKKVMEEGQSPEEIDQIGVMYIAGDPTISRFTENLESQNFTRFLNIIFMVVAFIFSAVFVFSFYQTVFGPQI
ncbi:hypothetical protein PY092_01590 [Muricauda sp. 334s03]|uniref:Uncharacterized protein n=1 Tax=Flagellimonas yonaguniensis TaxID=3031325 RepID=A0ABT5XUG5_9FLAO|nr:hypothetical protein [[Muricauda] yonaguniensis]MDF0714827.1 hypothetical protein [[Muricauda] yonaguniensis]